MSVPLALSIAISIRVGNLLGAGDPQRAPILTALPEATIHWAE